MDLSKKEIIYELAKGVHGQLAPQSYGAMRRRLTDSQGVSEIALYSAVAEHLEENDIHPSKYVTDMWQLLLGTSDNLFFLKTEDRFSYLRNAFSSINMDNSPESKGQFLCMKCYTIKSNPERCGRKNYKNVCSPCYKAESKMASRRYTEKKKIEKQEQALNPTPEPKPEPKPEPELISELEPVSVPEPLSVTEPQIPAQQVYAQTMKSIEVEPYIEIESITGDGNDTIVSITCDTLKLAELLLLLDPFLTSPKKRQAKAEAEAEAQEKAELKELEKQIEEEEKKEQEEQKE